MGLITTTGNYCFVRCDCFGCAAKIEHVDRQALIRLVRICEWVQRGKRWLCPDCAKGLMPGVYATRLRLKDSEGDEEKEGNLRGEGPPSRKDVGTVS